MVEDVKVQHQRSVLQVEARGLHILSQNAGAARKGQALHDKPDRLISRLLGRKAECDAWPIATVGYERDPAAPRPARLHRQARGGLIMRPHHL
eukprot:scaffold19556_cov98-Isochrysis_galbana.AAC.2